MSSPFDAHFWQAPLALSAELYIFDAQEESNKEITEKDIMLLN